MGGALRSVSLSDVSCRLLTTTESSGKFKAVTTEIFISQDTCNWWWNVDVQVKDQGPVVTYGCHREILFLIAYCQMDVHTWTAILKMICCRTRSQLKLFSIGCGMRMASFTDSDPRRSTVCWRSRSADDLQTMQDLDWLKTAAYGSLGVRTSISIERKILFQNKKM